MQAPIVVMYQPPLLQDSSDMSARPTKCKQPSGAKDARSTAQVIEILCNRIRHGTLVPGQRLVEADIVKDTGASRGRVREALKKLESQGLVSIEEFRGASVRQLSMDEVRQIYKSRMALEGMLAAEFAASDQTALKKRLQGIQERMNDLEKTGDHRRFAKLNDEWHGLIIKASGNQYAAHFLSQLSVPVYRLLFASFYSSQRIDKANADHRLVTEAIIEGKPRSAEKAMRSHIIDGFAALMEMHEKMQI